MTVEEITHVLRMTLYTSFLVASPVLGVALFVGLTVSILQSATQINEQTLSFLPRLLTTLITIMIAGPWLLSRLMEFTNSLYGQIPGLLG